ncbi:MAG TPA: hypothetical protein VGI04_05695 [Neobacillus sp.]
MKKNVWLILFGIFLLAGCQYSGTTEKSEKKITPKNHSVAVEKKADTTFPYPNLLAENEQSYSLLVIGEQENKTPIEKNADIIKEVKNILSLPSLEMVNKIYPELHIEKVPTYILFDKSGIVQQSKSPKELSNYLTSNPAK